MRCLTVAIALIVLSGCAKDAQLPLGVYDRCVRLHVVEDDITLKGLPVWGYTKPLLNAPQDFKPTYYENTVQQTQDTLCTVVHEECHTVGASIWGSWREPHKITEYTK